MRWPIAVMAIALVAAPSLTAQTPQRIAPPAPMALTTLGRSAGATPPLQVWPLTAVRRAPSGRLVVGAVIGAVAGLATCTAISNISESEGGFHTCTAKGNVLFGGGGAVVGALVAHLTQ